MSCRVAIVLGGPPCGGKTTIFRELLRRTPSSHFVSLDDGRGPGEVRFLWTESYRDLRPLADTLVVEHGFGEPAGERFAGATRDPAAWLAGLADDNRSTHVFLLKLPIEGLRRRLARDRGPSAVAHLLNAAVRHEPGGVCSYDAFFDRLPSGVRKLWWHSLGLSKGGRRSDHGEGLPRMNGRDRTAAA